MRRWSAFVTLLALTGAPVGAWAQTAPRAPRVLVMPFDNVTKDNRIFWLGCWPTI